MSGRPSTAPIAIDPSGVRRCRLRLKNQPQCARLPVYASDHLVGACLRHNRHSENPHTEARLRISGWPQAFGAATTRVLPQQRRGPTSHVV
jgi:hypothetical protein